ncbi:EAL domain-containing protein [Francisellaceae bacterium]|nr:EAL domain-containing protein [Francisellaceae bacterium]
MSHDQFEAFKLVSRISKSPVCLVTLSGEVIKSNDLFKDIESKVFSGQNNTKVISSQDQKQFLAYLKNCFSSSSLIPGNINIGGIHYKIEGTRYSNTTTEESQILLYINTKDDFKNNIDILNKIVDLEIQISKQSFNDQDINQSKMFKLANYDHLTKLANKGYFESILNRAFKRSERSGQKLFLLFCDIDGFKNVNDTYGHFVGDSLLKHIATGLEAAVRDTDIVARFGGDEFVILLENINETSDLPGIINRIEKMFSLPIQIDHSTTFTTISVGLAEYPGDGKTTSELLKNADMAAYKAKKILGNSHCYFSKDLKLEMAKFNEIQTKLRLAIESELITIHYQPQFNVKSMQIIGMEALCRWKDADLGDIPPSVFFPIAEKTGLIKLLNDYIVNKALLEYAFNLENNPELFKSIKLSINIPKYYLSDKSEFNKLLKQINEKVKDINRICLEIAESNFIAKPDLSLQALKEANKNGIYSAIDNFGPGLVSLDLLKRMPSTVLKIHISFIHQICKSHNDFLIIKSLCILGKSLGMDVIAEGVETESQFNKLKNTTCKGVQGFLLAHPMPINELVSFIQSKNAHQSQENSQKQNNEFYD